MRRAWVELLIWSSRLLLPVAVIEHIWLSWAAAGDGATGGLLTLLAPGVAELVWLALGGAPAQVALYGLIALAAVLVAVGAAMALPGPVFPRNSPRTGPAALSAQAATHATALPDGGG